MTSVHTPAKLNLFLRVLGRRPDAFHELETLMVPVSLFDTLEFRPLLNSQSLSLRVIAGEKHYSQDENPLANIPSDHNNLVIRAIERLREEAGEQFGADIVLSKRIPAGAGLGGGSSDAAAALLAANHAWRIGYPLDRLAKFAGSLGSDIPFFLHRSAAWCSGRGEDCWPVPCAARLHFVIVVPPERHATPAVYSQLNAAPLPEGEPNAARQRTAMAEWADRLASGNLRTLSRHLKNDLQDAAKPPSPTARRIRSLGQAAGALVWQMTGSGSAWFGLCRTARHARQVAARMRLGAIGRTYIVSTT